MNPIWAILTCPVHGSIGKALRGQIQKFPQPWKTHALLCLNLKLLTATKTYIIVGLDQKLGLIASIWISLPDKIILSGWESSAFIFNVYVPLKYRGKGLGKHIVQMACSTAKSEGVDYILLATNQLELRDNFYSKLGFEPLDNDPWLMRYNCRLRKKNRFNLKIDINYIIRAVSPHDLATIQSICAHKHWRHENGNISISGPIECEEDFSAVFVNKTIFSQFLLKGKYHDNNFLSWVSYDESGELIQRILYDYNEKGLINISGNLLKLIKGIKLNNHLELLKLKPKTFLNFH